MPSPKKGEKKKDFISRCMSHDETKKKYPKQNQRYAVCLSMWNKQKKEMTTKSGKTYKIIKPKKT